MLEAIKVVLGVCLMMFVVVGTIGFIAVFIEATKSAIIKSREKRNQK